MQVRIIHVVCLLSCVAWTHAATEGGMEITNAWSRATPPGATTAVVYLLLANQSNLTITLTSIETPVAAMAHMHRTVSENGMAKMLPIDKLSLAPGEEIEFKPGGFHVMLMGLTRSLTEGETFPIKATFLQQPDLHLDVLVGAMGQTLIPFVAPVLRGKGWPSPTALAFYTPMTGALSTQHPIPWVPVSNSLKSRETPWRSDEQRCSHY